MLNILQTITINFVIMLDTIHNPATVHMTLMTCSHCRSRLRAARLQSYWKKVCEDERKSKDRNEQLLRDFGRVEAHIATLSSRTERLRLLKVKYE